jgi:hypothetical protein
LVKPSWTLRGEFHLGGVLFKSKEKHLKQGRKIQILKTLLEILLLYLWLFAKILWKDFPKEFEKKTSGANVVQNVKRKKAIHAYLVKV